MRKEISLLLILVLFATASTLVIKVGAATLVVDPITGPYTDIQLAINAASAWDTILVHPGNYIERGPFPIGSNPNDKYAPPVIVYKDGLTIKSTGGPGVTSITCSLTFWSNAIAIQYSTGGAVNQIAAPSAVIIVSNNVTIDGFTIVSNYVGDQGSTAHPNGAGVFIGGTYAGDVGTAREGTGKATIQNNVISGWSGIYIWKSPYDVIWNNTITIVPPNPSWANVPPGDGIEVWDGSFQGIASITSKGLNITGNQILGIPLAGGDVNNYDVSHGIGIGGSPHGTDGRNGITIGPCNTITNWVWGISIWNCIAGGSTGYPPLKINYCQVYGNIGGLTVSSVGTVNAKNVYWGDPTGPYNPTLNPGGLGNNITIGDTTTIVNFKPWKHLASCYQGPEYYLTVISPYGTASGQGWYNSGSLATFGISPNAVSGGAGVQYAFTGWSSSDSGGYTGSTSSYSVTMNNNITETANWKTQYYLTVNVDPTGLTTIPGEGWYDAGATPALTAPQFMTTPFLYWDVDGVSQGNTVNPITVTMNAAHTATAHYYVPGVGGEWAPVNVVQLAAPYVALAILAVGALAAGSWRLVRKRW